MLGRDASEMHDYVIFIRAVVLIDVNVSEPHPVPA
jgi:hypothetical protein